MDSQMPETLKLYVDKKRILIPLVFVAVLGLVALLGLLQGPSKTSTLLLLRSPVFYYPLMLLGVVLPAYIAFIGWRKLQSPLPEVELDSRGVRVNQDLHGLWTIFAGYREFKMGAVRGFVLVLKDPEAFLTALESHPRRTLIKAIMRGKLGSPFTIDTTRLICDGNQVEQFLRRHLSELAQA
jgi:hypothetical protein